MNRFYFLTFEFFPAVVVEFVVEEFEIFGGGEIDKSITNIALILNIERKFTLRSHGR